MQSAACSARRSALTHAQALEDITNMFEGENKFSGWRRYTRFGHVSMAFSAAACGAHAFVVPPPTTCKNNDRVILFWVSYLFSLIWAGAKAEMVLSALLEGGGCGGYLLCCGGK